MSAVEIVCPDCRAELEQLPALLRCTGCAASWPFEDGFPKLFREREVRASDRFMRLFYNGLPALHDPLTQHLLPLLQRDASESVLREQALSELALHALEPRTAGRPLSILEVGVGAGANLPFVARLLPPSVRVEYVGLDLSRGMLKHCRRRPPHASLDLRLLLGDAHSLPFRDHVFDRVFHIGAMGSYGAPERALREMARVARPNTPIVVVDEQLDRSRRNKLRDHLAFRLLTFYDRDPHCPRELLPREAVAVREVQLSRFYYSLKFSMPAASLEPTRTTSAP
jgi:SAM-dependent methyltransferase